jgi:hypothetical protein
MGIVKDQKRLVQENKECGNVLSKFYCICLFKCRKCNDAVLTTQIM